jgi:DNA-binding MarR family transcriptional regulator
MNKPFLVDEQAEQSLQHLSRLARSLADGLAHAAASNSGDRASVASKVRAYLRARRRRDDLFGSDVFADPVWDVLLDLYASTLEGRRVCISDACIAASVPSTTALRWIGKMEECKLIVRHQDETDGRRAYVELSAAALAAMELWLERFFAELHGCEVALPGGNGNGAARPPKAREVCLDSGSR